MLSPVFSNIPPELVQRSRWLVWRGAKVPYCATAPTMKASSTAPDTWSSFEQAKTTYEEGGFSGVGFALNNDGIMGVDLDKCVHGGTPDPAAIAILDGLQCSYIELSPSGNGLRAFGFGSLDKGTRGKLNGINVELYSTSRYLTVTGHAIKNGPLSKFSGLPDLVAAARSVPTEKYRDDSSHISVLSVLSVGDAIARTIPASDGQRNHCLFEFARLIKATVPDATSDELRSIVRQWHESALPFISTKEFSTSWYDFSRGFENIRYPAGTTLKQIIGEIDMSAAIPDGIAKHGYSTKDIRLFWICQRLQQQAGKEPFFISSRQAGAELEIHYTEAAKKLSMFQADGVIEEISKGAGNRASRYRFIWPE